MANPSMNHQARFGFKKTATSSEDATTELEILSSTLKKTGQHVQSPGIRGTRSYNSEGVNEGINNIGGTIVVEPRADNMEALFELILGGTPSTGVIGLATVLPLFNANISKVLASYRYAGLKVARATLRSSVNTPLNLSLDLMGISETSGVAFPSIAGTLSVKAPFMHHELVWSFGGSAYQVEDFTCTIDNGLVARHRNSQNPVANSETDRIVTVQVTLPHTSDESALQSVALAGDDSTAVWTKGGDSLSLAFAALQVPYESADLQGKTSEITRQFNWQARRVTTTDEIIATVVSV